MAFVSDICRIRLRYLSRSPQISVTFASDICHLQMRYHNT